MNSADPLADPAIFANYLSAEEDRRARELAEARNNGENAAYQAEKQLGELGDQVDADSKQRIEDAIKEVRESLEQDDPAAINAKTEALQTAFHAISEAMYQRAQQEARHAHHGRAAYTGKPSSSATARRNSGGIGRFAPLRGS